MSLRRKFHSSDLRGVAKVLLGAKRRRRWTWAGDSIRAAGGRCGQENKWAVENEMIITHRMSYYYSFHFTSQGTGTNHVPSSLSYPLRTCIATSSRPSPALRTGNMYRSLQRPLFLFHPLSHARNFHEQSRH